jgi:hypothetical protein
MLESYGAALNHPRGLNNRFMYFYCRNFFIHGQNELRETSAHQFQLHENDVGEEFLRFVFNSLYFLWLSSLMVEEKYPCL